MSNLENNTTELEEILQVINNLPDAGSGEVIAGEDGGYYIPSVSQPDANTMQVSFTPSKSDMTTVSSKNIALPKGVDGKDGTSVTVTNVTTSSADGGNNVVTFSDGKTLTVKNGNKGDNGTSATHSWNGTTLTITSASGTSSADLKGAKGDKGDKGDSVKGDKGDTGANGTSVTVTNVSTSTADGGSNVVTFSDGKTVTIKNGSKGSNGADGKTPVKGIDYWTEADKAEIKAYINEQLGVIENGTY